MRFVPFRTEFEGKELLILKRREGIRDGTNKKGGKGHVLVASSYLSLCLSVCLSIRLSFRPHGKTRLALDGFS
jgi:hypothetical protein